MKRVLYKTHPQLFNQMMQIVSWINDKPYLNFGINNPGSCSRSINVYQSSHRWTSWKKFHDSIKISREEFGERNGRFLRRKVKLHGCRHWSCRKQKDFNA